MSPLGSSQSSLTEWASPSFSKHPPSLAYRTPLALVSLLVSGPPCLGLTQHFLPSPLSSLALHTPCAKSASTAVSSWTKLKAQVSSDPWSSWPGHPTGTSYPRWPNGNLSHSPKPPPPTSYLKAPPFSRLPGLADENHPSRPPSSSPLNLPETCSPPFSPSTSHHKALRSWFKLLLQEAFLDSPGRSGMPFPVFVSPA